MQNIYVSHFDCKTNEFEVRHYNTGAVSTCGVEDMRDWVLGIKKPTIIYQNSVNVLARLISGGKEYGKKESKYTNTSEIITYKIGKVTFKSFTVLCPADQTEVTMMDMYGVKTPTESMIAHIEYLGGLKNLSRTICGQSIKIFYKDIKDELWQWKKDNKVYINTVEEFNLLHSGCKCGVLYKANCIEKHGKTLEFDLSAAYCGAFVQSDKFPIGKPRFTTNPRIFISELKKGNNVKVIFDTRIPEIDEATSKIYLDLYDDYNNVTALELYDLKLLSDLGVNITKLITKYHCKFVYYDETGYIHEKVRDKICYLQYQKDHMKKGTPERSLVKCQMEFIYGKPIQKRSFKSDAEVVRHYRLRGENYITPQMSNHASAYVRYQIFKAIKELGEYVYYYDTDGIKVADNEITRSYFAEQNEILMNKNYDSGYDTNIGTWKIEEFDQFLYIRPKMYITKNNGEDIEYTLAGIDEIGKRMINSFLLENGIKSKNDNAVKFLYVKGIPFYQKAILLLDDLSGVEIDYKAVTWLR